MDCSDRAVSGRRHGRHLAIVCRTIGKGRDRVTSLGGNGEMVNVGDDAPDFTLRGAHGATVRLNDLRGKQRALLIFYPKDMTSG